MGKRTELNLNDMLRVMRHLADVAALHAEPIAQRRLLVDGLNKIIGTNQAFFFIAENWQPGGKPAWEHQTLGSDMDPIVLKYMADFGINFPLTADPYAAFSIHNPAAVQTLTQHRVISDSATARQFDDFMQVVDAGDVSDGIVSMYRTGTDTSRVVGVGMHNFRSAGRLSPLQIALAEFAIAEIRNMGERGLLTLPPAARTQDLPPRLRQILDGLIAGDSPKSIARRFGLSLHTVRDHIKRLYRHFNVSGREELMAMFLKS